ncbi:uncharacterized protein SOCE26_005700 [Sorangium cellulosum]|uniref:Secreted protein n=1 Tax=Sorangium cellulosum TaxID=56 RepID=A0A2L0EIR9_SORCE|nr:hypothetical protein [Sorangium cellulosum]AUX39188.1 uncharacterized protein SOCE26_005700 [Sorangium cellulosum]
MRIRPGICAMGLSLAALAAGCGGGRDGVERQLSELRAEIVRVRADNAVLADRLGALERARVAARSSAPAPAAAPSEEPDRPDLEVVRLAPDGDGARPPVLRGTAGDVAVDEAPGDLPPGPSPSTLSRRKR